MERVNGVFIDIEDRIRFSKRFDFLRVKGGSKARKCGGVGVKKGVLRLEASSVPIMVGGEGLRLGIVFHMDYVGLLGGGGKRESQ